MEGRKASANAAWDFFFLGGGGNSHVGSTWGGLCFGEVERHVRVEVL